MNYKKIKKNILNASNSLLLQTTEGRVQALKYICAKNTSAGVWVLGAWFIYPKKGFAMHRYNTNLRMDFLKFLKLEMMKENICKNETPDFFSSSRIDISNHFSLHPRGCKSKTLFQEIKNKVVELLHRLL